MSTLDKSGIYIDFNGLVVDVRDLVRVGFRARWEGLERVGLKPDLRGNGVGVNPDLQVEGTLTPCVLFPRDAVTQHREVVAVMQVVRHDAPEGYGESYPA